MAYTVSRSSAADQEAAKVVPVAAFGLGGGQATFRIRVKEDDLIAIGPQFVF